jgi:hypothetical protein
LFLVEDYDYWIRVHSKSTIKSVHSNLYFYREHQGSLTTQKELAHTHAWIKLAGKHYAYLRSLEQDNSGVTDLKLALSLIECGDAAKSRAHLKRAIKQMKVVDSNTPRALEVFFYKSNGRLRTPEEVDGLLAKAVQIYPRLKRYRRGIIAERWSVVAFEAHQSGDARTTARAAWQAIFHLPGMARNRGLVKIGLLAGWEVIRQFGKMIFDNGRFSKPLTPA